MSILTQAEFDRRRIAVADTIVRKCAESELYLVDMSRSHASALAEIERLQAERRMAIGVIASWHDMARTDCPCRYCKEFRAAAPPLNTEGKEA